MGIRDDASLSARERADLANLEARAAADDPRLAVRLRGRGHEVWDHLPQVPAWLQTRWWGPVLVVAGLALAVLGLSTSILLSVAGILLGVAGGWLTATAVEAKLAARRPTAEPPE
jgi:hypothetical protein